MAKTSVTVVYHGSVFNGAWRAIMDAGVKEVLATVGEYAVQNVILNLDDVLLENSGAYISTIHSEWAAEDLAVTDGTVYGPWLEGLGSRNASTRFKGYWTFRKTTQEVKDSSGALAEEALAPFISEINI